MKQTQLTILSILAFAFATIAQVKPTTDEVRLQKIQQRKQLQQQSLVNHIPFRNIGPTVMSGRVVDVDVNPDDPTEFYVAYATGGLWHSTNNGQSFTPIFDSSDVLFIGDIAVNWQSKRRIIWVGTGEVNSSRSSYAGIGMYKSTNNGKTWNYLGLPGSHHIGKIQLHPTDENTAWVAAMGHLYSPNRDRGVYKTIDGGKTWKRTLFIDDNTGVVDIDMDPTNANILYAAAWYRTRRAWNFEEGGNTSGIYKSTDGGNTWNLLTAAGKGFPTGANTGRIGIAVFPQNPGIIYAVVDNQSPRTETKKKTDTTYTLDDFKDLTLQQFLQLDERKLDTFLKKNNLPAKYNARNVKEMVAGKQLPPSAIWDYLMEGRSTETPIGAEVYKSTNGGFTWQKTNEKYLDIYSTFGYYFGKVYVSAANPDKVLVSGITLLMSEDGGKTFSKIDKPNVHVDHHAVWINPKRDSHIFSGNDGGLNITYDDGKHWFLANSPAVGQFYTIAVDNDKPYNVYGGLQDNGTWFGPSTHKENSRWLATGNYPFKQITGGDGMQVQVDWRDNQTVYTGFQFGFYSRINTATKERKIIKPQHDLGSRAYRFNWQTPVLLSRHNQDVLYFGSNHFHRSLNKGDTLPAISPDLTTNPAQGDVPFGTLTTITESPLKFGLLYAGTDDGLIHLSRDGGYTWANISSTLPKGLWVSRLVASAHHEGKVYAALNGYRINNFLPYLYVSNDYGKTWKNISSNLPFEPINVIREDHRYDSLLYVGTDGGMYVTINEGQQYFGWNNGLPKSVPVHDMVIQERENELVLATHGRSIYIAKLDSVQLLMSNTGYRSGLQSRADRWKAALPPAQTKKALRRQKVKDVPCPPVKR